MISTLAEQMAQRDPDADSLMRRARDALRQLDRAAEQIVAEYSRSGQRLSQLMQG